MGVFFSFCYYCCSCIGWMSMNERLITSLPIWRCFIIETKAAWLCSVVYTSGILTDNFTNICTCYGCRTIFLSIIPSYSFSCAFFIIFCFHFFVRNFTLFLLLVLGWLFWYFYSLLFAWPFCWHFSFQIDWSFTALYSVRFAWSFWYFWISFMVILLFLFISYFVEHFLNFSLFSISVVNFDILLEHFTNFIPPYFDSSFCYDFSFLFGNSFRDF